MKKIFLILFIFLPFIFVDNVDALTYEKCGSTYEVNDAQSLLYYCYYTNPPLDANHSSYVLIQYNSSQYRCVMQATNDLTGWDGRYSAGIQSNNTFLISIYNSSNFSLINTLNNSITNWAMGQGGILYSNVNIGPQNVNGSTFTGFTANINLEDYFSDCPVINHYETKNEVFNVFMLDFVGLLPYIIVFILIFEGVGWFINKKD